MRAAVGTGDQPGGAAGARRGPLPGHRPERARSGGTVDSRRASQVRRGAAVRRPGPGHRPGVHARHRQRPVGRPPLRPARRSTACHRARRQYRADAADGRAGHPTRRSVLAVDRRVARCAAAPSEPAGGDRVELRAADHRRADGLPAAVGTGRRVRPGRCRGGMCRCRNPVSCRVGAGDRVAGQVAHRTGERVRRYCTTAHAGVGPPLRARSAAAGRRGGGRVRPPDRVARAVGKAGAGHSAPALDDLRVGTRRARQPVPCSRVDERRTGRAATAACRRPGPRALPPRQRWEDPRATRPGARNHLPRRDLPGAGDDRGRLARGLAGRS